MCRNATAWMLLACLVGTAVVEAQTAGPGPATSGWRRVGNNVLALGLASPAGGPVERIWFSQDGNTLFARTATGRVWQTSDLERWTAAPNAEPMAGATGDGSVLPPGAARSAVAALQGSRVYAAGRGVWRSDDGGRHWADVTSFQGESILGGPLMDIAASPTNPDEIVVAGASGVWRSVDAGDSWAGLNEGLPNLPGRRLVPVPGELPGVRIATESGSEYVWTAGEKTGWRPTGDRLGDRTALRLAAAQALGIEVTSAARSGEQVYAGGADGRLFSSSDRGRNWRPHQTLPGSGQVVRIFADQRDPLFALVITDSRQSGRVLRTLNGGVLWDDITGNLPAGSVMGIAADRLTGAVYLASTAGVFMTYTDTVAASPATPWTRLREEPALDVMLDADGNQLFALFDGLGVFAVLAPHRARDPRVVSAGDRVLRAAAPGSLLSVIGARVNSAQAGETPAAVLDAGEQESQVQLPFELPGNGVMISMESAAGRLQIGLPVAATSPSIFVDRDGEPLILNGDTGLMLDASSPARSNSRIQILATGLGRVSPDWPLGLSAPLDNPPKVIAPVRAYLDREPVEVTRATLAPGYVGLYVVEVQLPSLVNRGTAEFYIQAGEQTSNRVRIFLEP